MKYLKTLTATAAMFAFAGGAYAQEFYVGGSIGLSAQNDSASSGTTGSFTTGVCGDRRPTEVAAATVYGL